MKLEEAAEILGVKIDTPVDILKQTYRRLALQWHPDRCSKPNAKEKFQQVSIAYTKLISAHSINGIRSECYEFENESKKGEDSHEMAAFMRMFMDLVGIFNEEQSLTVDGLIPPSGVSFGMMFGSNAAEEWSTDDDIEIDDDDEEDDEDDDEEYEEEYYDSEYESETNEKNENKNGIKSENNIWEPQAKKLFQYEPESRGK